MWYGNTEGGTTIEVTGRVASRLKNEGNRIGRGDHDVLMQLGS